LLALEWQADHDSADGFAAAALASLKRFWVITNEDLRREISRQLPRLVKSQIIAEQTGRNSTGDWTRGLLLLRNDADAVIGMFPSDHVIADENRFRQTLAKAFGSQRPGENIVVLAFDPRALRPATATSRPVLPSMSRITRSPLHGET